MHSHGAAVQPRTARRTAPFTAPQVEYDMLDIDEPRFADDFSQFRRVVSDLERRLACVIIQVGVSLLN